MQNNNMPTFGGGNNGPSQPTFGSGSGGINNNPAPTAPPPINPAPAGDDNFRAVDPAAGLQNPQSPQNPMQNPNNPFQKPPKPPKEPLTQVQKLTYLSVGLGVLALIFIIVSAWLLINRSTAKTNTAKTETAQTVKQEPQYSATAELLGFYANEITNPTSEVIYRLGVHRADNGGNGVLGAYINADNTAVDLYIYWEHVGGFYGIEGIDRNDRELINITFDKKISDIAIGESGRTVAGDVLLFLLSDGTVEYLPIVDALTSRNFASHGQLAGVAEVVKFYNTDAVSDTGDWAGYATTLAQREDGSIIDLQNFLVSAISSERTGTN